MRRRMDPEKKDVLERQGYRIVGEHSGVKLCHWTKASLTKGIGCYKQTFYGIESHRCLQMTPTVDACNLSCQFCWRTQEWGSDSLLQADDPVFLVDESIRAQRELLSGYNGNPNVSRERFLEAWHPSNVAISLTGEPTLYKRLGEMIDEFKRRHISTFLVTNGTTPSVLRRMHAEGRLPTQLYVTVAAPNEEVYRKLVAPKSDHEFRKLRETLALPPPFPRGPSSDTRSCRAGTSVGRTSTRSSTGSRSRCSSSAKGTASSARAACASKRTTSPPTRPSGPSGNASPSESGIGRRPSGRTVGSSC